MHYVILLYILHSSSERASCYTLLEEQVQFFLENGYVVIKQAFTKEKADAFMENMWLRLDMDPNDKSTWTKERVHMPIHKREKVSEFAPKVSIHSGISHCVFLK